MKEITTPECEREKKGTIIIYNKSTNPYEIYQGDKYVETIEGGGTREWLVAPGTYQFKAQQKSGFMMYPTVNNRTATITEVCEKFPVKIGFED